MQRTKIVCTIGPASASATKLTSMMRAGMNVARLNMSHGTHAEHRVLVKTIRSVAKKLNLFVPIIGDIQGPKIRLGKLPAEGIELKTNQQIRFSTAQDQYENQVIPVTYKNLHKDVKVGHRFLIDDGLIELKITKVVKKEIYAKVINGGIVTSHKGMNFPDSHLSIGAITPKDKEDIRFAVEQGMEWIALSFVTSKKDVQALRRLIQSVNSPHQVLPRIIVKIEKHEALEVFDEILQETDAVMVARGDLGVEIPAEEVPIRQKELIHASRLAGKPVIVATQMLDSMIRQPRPTRAEVSDVANAVFDHTSAVMLSGESANGKYPVQAVKIMSAIIKESEASPYDDVPLVFDFPQTKMADLVLSIKLATEQRVIDGVLISIELTPWAESIHRAHPEISLFLGCPNEMVARQVSLRWGSRAFVIKNAREQTFVSRAIRWLLKEQWVKKGMRLAVISGSQHKEVLEVVTVS